MLRPDIFNMALALREQMNAEMRHVALASARVPVKPSYKGTVSQKLMSVVANKRLSLSSLNKGKCSYHNSN